jgi:dynein heavy chain
LKPLPVNDPDLYLSPDDLKLIKAIKGPTHKTPEDRLHAQADFFAQSIRKNIKTSFPDSIKQNIIKEISPKLFNSYNAIALSLLKEIEDEYMESEKKSAVSYVLRDFDENHEHRKPDIVFKDAPIGNPAPWHESFVENKAKLENDLQIGHPAMRKILDFSQHVDKVRFVDIDEIRKSAGRLRLTNFRSMILVQNEMSREKVLNNWLHKIGDMLKHYNFKSPQSKTKLLKCATAFIVIKVRHIILSSLLEYQSLFEEPTMDENNNRYPHFFIKVLLQNGEIAFDPTMKDVDEIVMDSINLILTTIDSIPALENLADTRDIGSNDLLAYLDMAPDIKIHIHEEFVEAVRKVIIASVKYGQEIIKSYLQRFEKYKYLTSEEIQHKIQQFFKENHTFDEYSAQIDHYRSVPNEIYSNPRSVKLPLANLYLEDYYKSLSEISIALSNQYLQKMLEDSAENQRKICQRYEVIEERALKTPETFKEMADLLTAMEHIKTQELPVLEKDLDEAKRRFIYMVNFSILTEETISLNNRTFTWPMRIKPILDRNEDILRNARDKNERSLIERRYRFENELEELAKQVDEFKQVGDIDEMPFYVKKVQAMIKQLTSSQETIQMFNREEALFGWPITSYPKRQEILENLEPYNLLYTTALNFQKSFKRWMDGNFVELDPQAVEEEVDFLNRELFRISNMFDDTSVVPKQIAMQVKEKIAEFTTNLPMIRILCNPGMRERHWVKMNQIANLNLRPDGATSLRKLLKLNLEQFTTQFQEISDGASKEYSLEKAMIKMIKEWDDVCFILKPYRDSGTSVISSVDEIQQLLDDQIVKTQAMRASPYIKPFENEMKAWEKKLLLTQEIVDESLKVQATWLYLEPIFSSEDIMSQMPEEGKKFRMVDATWREMMKTIQREQQVLKVADIPGLLGEISGCNKLLEIILKGLNEYLELKRLFFPRFFFLSNDEILEILSETKDPTKVQPHLRKCFEGIASLEFNDKMEITSVFSAEKERLPLTQKVSTAEAKGAVEKWLSKVESSMLGSVRNVMEQSLNAYKKTPREKWILEWPGQVVLCVGQIYWTMNVEKAFSAGKKGLEELYQKCTQELNDVIKLVRGDLTKMARITLGALVVIDVHARDIIQQLIQDGIKDMTDFSWLSQLRYYWENDDVIVRMINSFLPYGYEYLGNIPRLVITPLSDRCYRTLFGALSLNLGGAPEGKFIFID